MNFVKVLIPPCGGVGMAQNISVLALLQQKVNDMNPYYMDQMIKERRRETAAEARRLQLVAIYNAHNPGLGDRLLLALGNTLIKLGEHLKRRCEPQSELEAKLCREQ